MSSDAVIIEAAINGVGSKQRNPNIPRLPDEIVTETFACLDAGAGIIHAHNANIRLVGRPAAEREPSFGARRRSGRARCSARNDQVGMNSAFRLRSSKQLRRAVGATVRGIICSDSPAQVKNKSSRNNR